MPAFGGSMFRRVLSAGRVIGLAIGLVMGLAGLSAASLAADGRAKEPQSAFTAKMRPDILGISTDSAADSALAILEAAFKARAGTKTGIERQKSAGTAAG